MAEAPVLGGSETRRRSTTTSSAPRSTGRSCTRSSSPSWPPAGAAPHATRTRGKVRGGGAKPWRQKGTGRARAGSSRSPLWTGGGVVFGPSPRHYTVKVNRKARRAALRSALSIHAERGSIAVLDAGGFDAPSTKQAAGLLADRRGGAVLVVLGEDEAAAAKSFRNLEARHRAADGRRRAWPTSSAPPARGLPARRSTRSPARAREGPPARRGGERLMDATQIIIRPIVSEKSYVLATAGKYTFRVHPDAHKTQIKQAIEELFDVTVLEVRTRPCRPSPSAAATPPGARARGRRPSCRCARARRSRSSRAWRPISDADPQGQADLARPPLRDLLRLRGDHEDGAGEVADRGPEEVRRAQRQRPQDRRATAAAAPSARTA